MNIVRELTIVAQIETPRARSDSHRRWLKGEFDSSHRDCGLRIRNAGSDSDKKHSGETDQAQFSAEHTVPHTWDTDDCQYSRYDRGRAAVCAQWPATAYFRIAIRCRTEAERQSTDRAKR